MNIYYYLFAYSVYYASPFAILASSTSFTISSYFWYSTVPVLSLSALFNTYYRYFSVNFKPRFCIIFKNYGLVTTPMFYVSIYLKYSFISPSIFLSFLEDFSIIYIDLCWSLSKSGSTQTYSSGYTTLGTSNSLSSL